MSEATGIAWTDHTFNPWWGCREVSPGCAHCYAKAFDRRIGRDDWGDERRFFGDAHWNEPLKWNRKAAAAGVRRRVFCASMADVFEDRPDLEPWRARLFRLIEGTPHLDWQLLTKRPENVRRMVPRMWAADYWPPNAWLGFTAEDQAWFDRRMRAVNLTRLRDVVPILFCSYEPAIGPLTKITDGPADPQSTLGEWCDIDWLIVGGESGPGARPFQLAWARAAVALARGAGVAVFVKQLGSRVHDGVLFGKPVVITFPGKADNPDEWPAELRVRDFPEGRAA